MITINQDKVKDIERAKLLPLTKRQFAFYLDSIDMYDTIKTMIDADRNSALEYETTYKIERNSPTVLAIAQAMNWNAEQLDQMWVSALTL